MFAKVDIPRVRYEILYQLLSGKTLQANTLRKDVTKNGAGSLAEKHCELHVIVDTKDTEIPPRRRISLFLSKHSATKSSYSCLDARCSITQQSPMEKPKSGVTRLNATTTLMQHLVQDPLNTKQTTMKQSSTVDNRLKSTEKIQDTPKKAHKGASKIASELKEKYQSQSVQPNTSVPFATGISS